MNVSSLGTMFWTHETAMFGMTKIPAQHAHWFQQRFSINVWTGIVDGRSIGPYLLPTHLTCHTYLSFLQEVLGELLEDVSLDMRRRLWFEHDGAPPQFAGSVRDDLNRCFGQMDRPRRPDCMASAISGFNATRFFLWGHMKSLVYLTTVNTVEDLLSRVLSPAQEIQQKPCVMARVQQNIIRRYNVCNELDGRHIEPLL